MNRFILTTLILLLLNPVVAKTQGFDHLSSIHKKILAGLSNDHERVDTLIEWFYSDFFEPKLKNSISHLALNLARISHYRAGEATALNATGHCALDAGLLTQAEADYRESGDIRRSIGNYEGAASSYNNLGNALKGQGKHKAAIEVFQSGIDILPPNGSRGLLAILYNGKGICQKYLGAIDSSLASYNSSLEIAREEGDLTNLTKTNLNLAALLQDDLARIEKAGVILRDSLAFLGTANPSEDKARYFILVSNNFYYSNNIDSALIYLDRAEKLKAFLPVGEQIIINKNKGRLNLEIEKYDLALGQFDIALKGFESVKDFREITGTKFEIGNLYFEKADFGKARQFYEEALDECNKMDDPLLKSRVLFMLGETFSALKLYELASNYKSEYITFNDSIKNNTEQGMAYQLKLGDIQNELVLKNLKQTQVKAKTMQTFNIISFIMVWLVIGSAVMAVYLNRQRRKLAEQQAVMVGQEAIEQIRIKELEANQARLESEEITRTRIGRELHDGLGSMLTTVKLYFSSVDEKIDTLQEESREQYQKANKLLDEAYEHVRALSHEMMSAMLVKFGLKAQLESLAEAIRDTGKLEVDLSTHGLENRLNSKFEFNIYRIVQELVNNVIKHSKANHITIQVNKFDSLVNINVEDNGVGFNYEEIASNGSGIGLKNIDARLHEMDGTINFDSKLGKGTFVSIDIPLLSFDKKITA